MARQAIKTASWVLFLSTLECNNVYRKVSMLRVRLIYDKLVKAIGEENQQMAARHGRLVSKLMHHLSCWNDEGNVFFSLHRGFEDLLA